MCAAWLRNCSSSSRITYSCPSNWIPAGFCGTASRAGLKRPPLSPATWAVRSPHPAGISSRESSSSGCSFAHWVKTRGFRQSCCSSHFVFCNAAQNAFSPPAPPDSEQFFAFAICNQKVQQVSPPALPNGLLSALVVSLCCVCRPGSGFYFISASSSASSFLFCHCSLRSSSWEHTSCFV